MSGKSGKLSLFRPRFLTLIVLIVVAAPIAVANLSHVEVTPQVGKPPTWPPPERSYGWPLIWYWCEFKPPAGGTPWGPKLVRWSAPRLACNLATWFATLAVAGVACQWLLRRYGPFCGFRPRVLTLIALTAVAGLIVLANLTCDVAWNHGSGPALLWQTRPTYGWPLFWRWHNVLWTGYGPAKLDQNFSAGRLMGNLVVWLVILGAAAVACQSLLRRYRPRLRWSLRMMLAVVGLMAALCAWCAALRDRANTQDAVISEASSPQPHFYLHLEHWGPKWADFLGAGRFFRRIAGAVVSYSDGDERFLERLGRSPGFRYLNLNAQGPTPQGAPALGNLSPECLSAVGKLDQLEDLHLVGMIDSGGLARLAGLTRLKTLSLQSNWYVDEEGSDENETQKNEWDEPDRPEDNDAMPLLAHLPALPRLESIELHSLGASFYGQDYVDTIGVHELRQLAALPRLKSLNLSGIDVTDAGLAELASLEALEELAIGGDTASAAGLRSLRALKHLKALHILRCRAVTDDNLAELLNRESIQKRDLARGVWPQTGFPSPAESELLHVLKRLKALRIDQYGSFDRYDRLTTVALDHGDRVFALESELDDFHGALQALRQANPGIVIDSDPKWFFPYQGLQFLPFLANLCSGP